MQRLHGVQKPGGVAWEEPVRGSLVGADTSEVRLQRLKARLTSLSCTGGAMPGTHNNVFILISFKIRRKRV